MRGEGTRTHLISREHGYHGTHGIATSILGMPYREGFGELVADTSRVAWDDAAALEAEIRGSALRRSRRSSSSP